MKGNKKLGIITLSSDHNYESMLQTYAIQKFAENKGFDVEIINYRLNIIDRKYNPFRRKRKGFFDLGFCKQRFILRFKENYKIEKYYKFEKFLNKHLNITSTYSRLRQLRDAKFDFDYYICGMGSIWDPKITKGIRPEYFLDFANENAVKIAYGPNIGDNFLDEFYSEILEHYIKNFDYISLNDKISEEYLVNYTNKSIENVITPILLLNKEDYDLVKDDSEFESKEYILVYASENNKHLTKIAEEISKDKNIPIIFNGSKKKFKNQIGTTADAGPSEFLGAIYNAKYVVTNSFVATLFSIVYNKDFVAMDSNKENGRIKEILNNLGLQDFLFENFYQFKSAASINVDFDELNNNIQLLIKNSRDFLENSLTAEKEPIIRKSYFESNDIFACYGCYACEVLCPQDAITMVEDNEGFFYPTINQELCNNCNICRNKCIYGRNDLLENNEGYPKVCATYNKDDSIRMFSTSGGVFLPIADKIIKKGGYVVGAAYDDEMNLKHMISNSWDGCIKFSGSKYVRSDISKIFPKIKEILDSEPDKPLLFTGLPCQIAGLKAYLGKYYSNLFLLELICHSSPSPKAFRLYLDYLEKKQGSKVVDFKFRDKKLLGWAHFSVLITFEDGSVINESALKENDFTRAFSSGIISRPCCYSCEFTYDKRVGDITLADFWGIGLIKPELNDDKGTSLIIINNSIGEKLFEEVAPEMIDEIFVSDMENAFRKNHKYPLIYSKKRVRFFWRLEKEPIEDILLSYNHHKQRKFKKESMKHRKTKKIVKKILPKKLFNKAKKVYNN